MKPTRYYSKKQEKRIAGELGAKRQANSGATPFNKGDVKDDYILFECKTKINPSNSITLKKEWFDKNNEEAFAMGKYFGIIIFSFGDNKDYVALSLKDFKLLYEAWKQINEGEEE